MVKKKEVKTDKETQLPEQTQFEFDQSDLINAKCQD